MAAARVRCTPPSTSPCAAIRTPSTGSIRTHGPGATPESAKSSISDFPILRVDNREFHGPPKGPEQQCFSQPSSSLYCTRTNKETWIGFRWYKFVDQPEMTNVFLSLPEGERQQAKDFMQVRSDES